MPVRALHRRTDECVRYTKPHRNGEFGLSKGWRNSLVAGAGGRFESVRRLSFCRDLQGKLRNPKQPRHQGCGYFTATRQQGTLGRIEARVQRIDLAVKHRGSRLAKNERHSAFWLGACRHP